MSLDVYTDGRGEQRLAEIDGAIMRQQGHTIVELTIVLAVIAILGGIGGPSFLRIFSKNELRVVTQEIGSELRLARQLAATHRDRIQVAFDVQRNQIETRLVGANIIHHQYRFGERRVRIDGPSDGLEIVFHPTGRSATATTIRLHNMEGETSQLTVGITGRVNLR